MNPRLRNCPREAGHTPLCIRNYTKWRPDPSVLIVYKIVTANRSCLPTEAPVARNCSKKMSEYRVRSRITQWLHQVLLPTRASELLFYRLPCWSVPPLFCSPQQCCSVRTCKKQNRWHWLALSYSRTRPASASMHSSSSRQYLCAAAAGSRYGLAHSRLQCPKSRAVSI